MQKKDLDFSRAKMLMVELVENSLHSVIDELERWQSVIGEDYLDDKIAKDRKIFLDKATGSSTLDKVWD